MRIRLLVIVDVIYFVSAQQVEIDAMLESEHQLKRMVNYVTPLMAILHKPRVKKRQIEDRNYSGGGSDYYYQDTCYGCEDKHKYLEILSVIALGLLFLFLIALLSTTTSSSGRKKRTPNKHQEEEVNNLIDEPSND